MSIELDYEISLLPGDQKIVEVKLASIVKAFDVVEDLDDGRLFAGETAVVAYSFVRSSWIEAGLYVYCGSGADDDQAHRYEEVITVGFCVIGGDVEWRHWHLGGKKVDDSGDIVATNYRFHLPPGVLVKFGEYLLSKDWVAISKLKSSPELVQVL